MVGRKSFFSMVFAVVLAAMPSYAQTLPSMNLNLKNGMSSPNFGEFRISFASQILGAGNADASRFQYLENSALRENSGFTEPIAAKFEEGAVHHREFRDLGYLTLSATYFQDTFGHSSTVPRSLGARKRLGRWAVYGEITQKDDSERLTLRRNVADGLLKPSLMANVTAGSQVKSVEKPNVSDISEENELPSLKDYYLEATYNFMPSVKGKVSYKRSQFDAIERKENLQVEGIVETGKDVMIKAGYRNQTTPELRDNEGKRPNNTKVWTEFILKF